jgi:hypothetical protein
MLCYCTIQNPLNHIVSTFGSTKALTPVETALMCSSMCGVQLVMEANDICDEVLLLFRVALANPRIGLLFVFYTYKCITLDDVFLQCALYSHWILHAG